MGNYQSGGHSNGTAAVHQYLKQLDDNPLSEISKNNRAAVRPGHPADRRVHPWHSEGIRYVAGYHRICDLTGDPGE